MSEGHNQGPLSRQEINQKRAELYRFIMRRHALLWREYRKIGDEHTGRARESLAGAIRMRNLARQTEKQNH